MIAKISFGDDFSLVQHLLHTCIQRAIAILSNRVTCCPVCIIQSIWNSFFLFFKPEQKKVLVEVVTLLLITMWVSIDGAIYCFTVHFCHLSLLLGICCSVTHSPHQVLSATERFHGGGCSRCIGGGGCPPLAPKGSLVWWVLPSSSTAAYSLQTSLRKHCCHATGWGTKITSGKDGTILKWFEGPKVRAIFKIEELSLKIVTLGTVEHRRGNTEVGVKSKTAGMLQQTGCLVKGGRTFHSNPL